ncbi:MAG: hypothetical protein QXP58_09645 [Thermoprotei archaeon]
MSSSVNIIFVDTTLPACASLLVYPPPPKEVVGAQLVSPVASLLVGTTATLVHVCDPSTPSVVLGTLNLTLTYSDGSPATGVGLIFYNPNGVQERGATDLSGDVSFDVLSGGDCAIQILLQGVTPSVTAVSGDFVFLGVDVNGVIHGFISGSAELSIVV